MHLLYKYPGPHILEDGCGYEWAVFDAPEDGEAQGWSRTYWEAKESAKNKEAEKPLTRQELEILAKEAGIKFDGRMSDATLDKKVKEWATAKSNS